MITGVFGDIVKASLTFLHSGWSGTAKIHSSQHEQLGVYICSPHDHIPEK